MSDMAHTNPTSRAVAASVSQVLKEHDLTLEDVVNATGISYGTLWRRTNCIGKRVFDIDELTAIAGMVGITLTDLFARAEAIEAAA